ncbi:MAG: nuclear transport factor 2 family protein [Ideonella sp.]|nr:nuclear transport factor 2 family protein [Ideonella sp.]
MNRDTITRFYAAFAQLDGDTMQACYAADAEFEDPVFTLEGRHQVGGMWRMLCEATRSKGRDAWRLEASQITDHSAHWEAHYRFSATGRLVHNIIDAEFEFTPAGLIRRHRDRFSFWRWSRQALGAPGVLLGWSPIVRNKVRAQAAANLALFLARQPAKPR